ncbi:phage tail tube protein [Paenibacillus sp. J2TS4]|uniref:phage tail tube protein n=1 Tax=Paenibacillus sp. J2TS4 TaxID=2807194 RepID=UPI001B15733D|nr:phage tail tube protein [Paenibacillus sp. J2TS4]GIP35506.1 phage protein [Paenibacillus sp. J2TS4]
MAWLRARDTISGQEGRAYAKIGNDNIEMFYIKTLEATVEKEKAEVKTLGRRGTQHKATGWTGTGSMTIYYVTTRFRELMYDYMKTGVDTYFEIEVINEDPASSIGSQTVRLKGVNLNSVVMASLDTESEALEEELEFTFEDVDIIGSFRKPTE